MNQTTVDQAALSTDIFVPQHLYPNNFKVNLSSDLTWKFDSDSSKVIITLKSSVLEKIKTSKKVKSTYSVEILPED